MFTQLQLCLEPDVLVI